MRAMQPKLPMPPKCCKNPIPGWIVKAVLNPKEQQSFLQRISQSATLWDDKITCPNTRCRAVMSNDPQVDARRPYEMICAKCRTKVCRTCKKMAHSLGPICPNDWELDAVLQMKEGQGWRRCYNGRCRAIVPLSRGRAHMKCRCKAEFCYLCGAIWNPTSGCLNACDTKELKVEYEKGRELKDKIDIIAAQMLEADVESATEKLEAAQRTQDNEELKHLLIRHLEERDRFMGFEKQQKWFLWTRQGQEKVEMLDRHAEARTKMEEQHQTTATTLEDRQVTAEMEFRKTLDQERKACEVRLRHMEAYCHGLNAKGTVLGRVVTERDLRELDQQYNVRDNMERLQESRINVLREKQAKALKTLMTKQVEVCGSFEKDLVKEGEELDQRFSQEEEDFTQLFRERKDRLEKRWRRRAEIVRKKLAVEMGLTYGPLPPVDWSIVEKEAEKMSIPVTDLIADVALKTRAAFSEEPIITTEEELGLGEPVTGEDAMDHGSIKAAA
ncbi:MAG: hypothetical protein M1827_007451 [Pycnora praestabilis]|nr:MAG: hypothetical protein M1827_007451 [Pycnora praestabilis]